MNGPRRAGRGLAALLVLGGLAACGGDDAGAGSAPAPAGCRAAVDGEVALVALDLAFDADCLEVPADEPVTVVLDNQDVGVNHNLAVGAPDTPATKLEPGPVVQRLDLRLAAGTYVFLCDIHPNMTGKVVAAPR